MSGPAKRRAAPRPAASPSPPAPEPPAPEATSVADAPSPASGSLASTLRSTQRAPGPAGQLLADAPHRAVALLVDMIVVGLVGTIVAATLGSALGGLVSDRTLETAGGELAIGPFIVVLVIVLALSLLYFVAGWTRWQATLGMRLLGLAILDDGGAHHISAGQAVIRWLVVGIPATIATVPVFVPSVVAIVLAIVGLAALVGLLVTIGQSPTRQGLHDRYAGSIVTTVSRRRLQAR